jgi:hypothetical protein
MEIPSDKKKKKKKKKLHLPLLGKKPDKMEDAE